MLAGPPTVSIWWCRPLRRPGDEAALDAGALGRLAALVHPDDRASFVSARQLARAAVADACAVAEAAVSITQRCERCGKPHGPPIIADPGDASLRLSWTRTRRFVAVAVASVPVGVDAEPAVRRGLDPAVVLTAVELRRLAQLPGDRGQTVLQWWVRKEAVLKARGEGLDVVNPAALEVAPPGPPAIVTSPAAPGLWVQDVSAADDVAVAVAAACEQCPIVRVTELSLAGAVS